MILLMFVDTYVTDVSNNSIRTRMDRDKAVRFNSFKDAFEAAKTCNWERSVTAIDENNPDRRMSYEQFRTLLHMRKCLGLTEDGDVPDVSIQTDAPAPL